VGILNVSCCVQHNDQRVVMPCSMSDVAHMLNKTCKTVCLKVCARQTAGPVPGALLLSQETLNLSVCAFGVAKEEPNLICYIKLTAWDRKASSQVLAHKADVDAAHAGAAGGRVAVIQRLREQRGPQQRLRDGRRGGHGRPRARVGPACGAAGGRAAVQRQRALLEVQAAKALPTRAC